MQKYVDKQKRNNILFKNFHVMKERNLRRNNPYLENYILSNHNKNLNSISWLCQMKSNKGTTKNNDCAQIPHYDSWLKGYVRTKREDIAQVWSGSDDII